MNHHRLQSIMHPSSSVYLIRRSMCSRENLKNKIARFSHPPDVKKTTMHNCTRTIELLCSTSVYSSISSIASPVMVSKGKSIALLFMLL